MNPSFPKCPQCGNYHPALKTGAICPCAKVKDNEGKDIDFSKFFSDLKNICTSQIHNKGIKDVNKLFTFTIVQLTKIFESYKE